MNCEGRYCWSMTYICPRGKSEDPCEEQQHDLYKTSAILSPSSTRTSNLVYSPLLSLATSTVSYFYWTSPPHSLLNRAIAGTHSELGQLQPFRISSLYSTRLNSWKLSISRLLSAKLSKPLNRTMRIRFVTMYCFQQCHCMCVRTCLLEESAYVRILFVHVASSLCSVRETPCYKDAWAPNSSLRHGSLLYSRIWHRSSFLLLAEDYLLINLC